MSSKRDSNYYSRPLDILEQLLSKKLVVLSVFFYDVLALFSFVPVYTYVPVMCERPFKGLLPHNVLWNPRNY